MPDYEARARSLNPALHRLNEVTVQTKPCRLAAVLDKRTGIAGAATPHVMGVCLESAAATGPFPRMFTM